MVFIEGGKEKNRKGESYVIICYGRMSVRGRRVRLEEGIIGFG